MKTRITKCYLVQILDDKGNELACEYVFDDKETAKETARVLKQQLKEDAN